MNHWKELLGEFLGTALLVFIGCGSVAIAVLYYPLELWHIALVWSFGVALAIYATNKYSSSHLNPAVTFAMAVTKKCEWRKVPSYFIAQTLGAMAASLLLLVIVNKDIYAFELSNGFVRGDKDSWQSAVMFGEFFKTNVSQVLACTAEGFGTFTLVIVIFLLTHKTRTFDKFIPILIGLTVGAIIMVVAPYTQAGLNPARDFGPRLVAYFGGWRNAAFPSIPWSFLTVYILSPLVGGVLAHICYSLIYKRSTLKS